MNYAKALRETNLTKRCQHCDGTGKAYDDEAIGNSLREFRKGANLTLREVARRMELSAAYLSDLELGRRHWSTDLIEEFQRATS